MASADPAIVRLRSAWQGIQAALHPSTQVVPGPGLYKYDYQQDGERARVHLRIDPDASGVLLVNASRVMHLNPTAVLLAYLSLEKTPPPAAIRLMCRVYQVSKSLASQDYIQFRNQLAELIRPDGACPICDLDLEVRPPFSARPSAPYRMDLAVTYRCNNDCPHCYNARERSFPELPTDAWKRLLDRIWEVGIPHVVFTGGEPSLRADLPELVAYAQSKGQVTGMNTNARRLSDPAYVQKLVDAGLDHVQITLESHDPVVHDRMVAAKGAWKQTVAGLRNVLDSPLFVMTNTTLLQENSPCLGETLDFLAQLGVPTVGLNALIYSGRGATVGTGLSETALPPLLDLAREKTDAADQRLIWYTPTQYCHFDPMQLELGVKACTAALYNMCVEPDGSVLPCQSYYQSLGNLLEQPWEAIWEHPLALHLRERRYVPAKCKDCALLAECGGGCPLTYETSTLSPL
jgi:radical SAM protein with 4Fe4S-binding SPASM domain